MPKLIQRFSIIAVVVLALAVVVVAPASPSESHPTLTELEGEIMCPTCHTTLDQSNSPEARRIEGFIARRIAAGDNKSEIKAKLVAQFGTSILAAPPLRGFGLLAWWLPIAGIVAAAAIVGVSAWRWSRRSVTAAAEPALPALDPELERRLDDELSRY